MGHWDLSDSRHITSPWQKEEWLRRTMNHHIRNKIYMTTYWIYHAIINSAKDPIIGLQFSNIIHQKVLDDNSVLI